MVQENYYPLEGTHGFLLKKLSQDIHADVKNMVDNIQSNFNKATPYNNELEGQINKEYKARLSYQTTQYIIQATEQYCNANPYYLRDVSSVLGSPFTLGCEGEAWVNFQEKYEYNPMHRHNGMFSFVIWHQIPFYKEDEIKYGAGRNRGEVEGGKNNHNGEFEFIHYNKKSIVSTPLNIDKRMEGYMAIFPSDLLHMVYPFYTSDDYRITISGNVHLHLQ